jgi:hypothetical protein
MDLQDYKTYFIIYRGELRQWGPNSLCGNENEVADREHPRLHNAKRALNPVPVISINL